MNVLNIRFLKCRKNFALPPFLSTYTHTLTNGLGCAIPRQRAYLHPLGIIKLDFEEFFGIR
jgi:hypothetical protein